MSDFKTIIGLEIHAHLKTKSKMFCRCENNPHPTKPNSQICPVCMGMPGTLPVPNCKAIEMTIKFGMAVGSEIAKISKFDRKHYFYPDLPKGYQISQYDQPFCKGGSVEVGGKKVRLNRIHLEEDAGKLIHQKSGITQIDLNRAGTPLLEIVTEPDITSPAQAKEFLKELQLILRKLDVSVADMEKGHLRSDANINVIKGDKSSPIVEIKNLNSFRFIEKALEYEKRRLMDEFESFSGKKNKITRGFDAKKAKTYILREKEEAKDYRYFPEPDIPPFETSSLVDLKKLRASSKDLPSDERARLRQAGLSPHLTEIIVKNPKKLEAINLILHEDKQKILIAANLIVNEKKYLDLSKDDQIQTIEYIFCHKPPSNIIRKMIENPSYNPVITSGDDIDSAINNAIKENQDAVLKIKKGNNKVLGFLIGQVMKKTKNQSDPNKIRRKILERIENDK